MKKVINTEHLGQTMSEIEKFIRENCETCTPDSDYLGYKLNVIIELIKD